MAKFEIDANDNGQRSCSAKGPRTDIAPATNLLASVQFLHVLDGPFLTYGALEHPVKIVYLIAHNQQL